MKAREFRIRRQAIPAADAQRRWDQAYQNLIRWSLGAFQDRLQEALQKEERNESGDVCARLYATASTSSDD
jgi:hypothetical protein